MASMQELRDVGVTVPRLGWYDVFNDCIYWKREDALRAVLGGNKVYRLEGLRRKPIEEFKRAVKIQTPDRMDSYKTWRQLTAFNFLCVWLHTSSMQREYVYNDFRIQDFRREYRRACRG